MTRYFVLACLLPHLIRATPSSIHLGFVFPMLNNGTPASQMALQLLPAFLLAVSELNNKSVSGLLPSTSLQVAVQDSRSSHTGALGAALGLASAFGGEGVGAVVGAEDTSTSVAMQNVFGDLNTLQVGYSSGNQLANPDLSLTYVSTVPFDSTDGRVIADLIGSSWLQLHRVVVFYSTDFVGLGSFRAFQSQAGVSDLLIVGSFELTPTSTDYSALITSAMTYSPRIIVILSSTIAGAALLEQAFDMGLLHEGVTVFGNSYLASVTALTAFSSIAKASQVLRGFIGVRHLSDVWMSTPSGLDFLSRSESFIANNNNCSQSRTDDTGAFYFLKDHANSSLSSPYVCATLNLSSIASDPSNYVNPIVAYVYDAVYTTAYAIHEALYIRNVSSLSASDMKSYLTGGSFLFKGITGDVAFTQPVVPVDSGGNRIRGQQYAVLNFQSVLGTGQNFPSIGTYDIDSRTFALCTSAQLDCASPVFNTASNNLPTDSPPAKVETISDTAKTAIPVVISFYLLQYTILFVSSIVFRNKVTFKTAQVIAIWFVLTGILFGCIRVLLTIFDLTANLCVAEAFIGEISFFLNL